MADFLLTKNYVVHGIKRKSSSFNTERLDHLYTNNKFKKYFFLHYGDVTDYNSIEKIINKVNPDEIYNLAAQSHVATSFELPIYTAQVNGIGALNILEVIRTCKKKIKFYQASSSEMYGKIQDRIQNENTKFYPLSIYATSKLFAYWITINYRESFNIFACNGILFNHESSRRGETFVTRKITYILSRICFGLEKSLSLGNIYSRRDWGSAQDYVEMQWKMLQQKKPNDFVVSTGNQYSVKDFVNISCKLLKIKIKWSGKGLNERAIVINCDQKISPFIKKGMVIVKIDKKYFRPNDVVNLVGNSEKAKKILGWKPKKSIESLVEEMIKSDYEKTKIEYYRVKFKK